MSKITFCQLNQLDTKLSNAINYEHNRTLIIIIDNFIYENYQKYIKQQLNYRQTKLIKINCLDAPFVKSLRHYEKIVSIILGDNNINRHCHILAIGGGSLIDLAGFIAATLLRQVSWSVIPTSYLAMIDSSIGGKVGLDTDYGKNLIGAFHKPKNIWICSEFLRTMKKSDLMDNYGELIKYALLDNRIYEKIIHSKQTDDLYLKLIKDCAELKYLITENDYKENKSCQELKSYNTSNILNLKRICLNLGHSLAHPIETISGFNHGKCVIYGLYLEALMLKDLYQSDQLQKLNLLLKALNLEIDFINNLKIQLRSESYRKKFLQLALLDKKNSKQKSISILLTLKKDKFFRYAKIINVELSSNLFKKLILHFIS